jgi:hypothetical protein
MLRDRPGGRSRSCFGEKNLPKHPLSLDYASGGFVPRSMKFPFARQFHCRAGVSGNSVARPVVSMVRDLQSRAGLPRSAIFIKLRWDHRRPIHHPGLQIPDDQHFLAEVSQHCLVEKTRNR